MYIFNTYNTNKGQGLNVLNILIKENTVHASNNEEVKTRSRN